MRVLQGGHLTPAPGSTWYRCYGVAARHVLDLDSPLPAETDSENESDGIGCGGDEPLGDPWALGLDEEAVETTESAAGPSFATWTTETGSGPELSPDKASGPPLCVDSCVGPANGAMAFGWTVERSIGPNQNREAASGPDDGTGLRPGVERASGPDAMAHAGV